MPRFAPRSSGGGYKVTGTNKRERVIELRDIAVVTAMRHGAFEVSGDTRLVVVREADLMLTYRTPFNPLPKLTESMRFDAAVRGKNAYREPYGIEIWQDRRGKVLSIGWQDGNAPVVDGYERGTWEQTLAHIADHKRGAGLCPECPSAVASRRQPLRKVLHGHAGSSDRPKVSGRAGRDG